MDAEVISGDEEATLSFVGAVGELDADDGPFVVVDVGGGSTEVVLGALEDGQATVHAARSVDVGSVRITERACPAIRPTAREIAKAREVAAGILADAFAAVPVEEVCTWVGVAGTITTLAAVAQDLPRVRPGRRCTSSGSAAPTCTGWPASCSRMSRAERSRHTARSTPAGSTSSAAGR